MGRPNKYGSVILPNIDKIERWVKDGATNKAIAEKLGIAYSSFQAYIAEAYAGNEIYSALLEAYAHAREIADEKIENALFKSATGYTWTEVTREEITDAHGHVTVKEKTRTVDVPASVPAQQFWLINRNPERWKSKRENEAVEENGAGIVVMPEVKADE